MYRILQCYKNNMLLINKCLTVVASGSVKKFIVRGYDGAGRYKVGTLHREERTAYFTIPSQNGTATQLANFDVLINEYDCDLTWVEGNKYAYFIYKLFNTSTIPLGRTSYEGTWYPGAIYSSETLTAAIDNSTELVEASDFQYLISSSAGFQLEIRDFIFEPDIFGGNPTLMGYDEIHNLSNCSITQTLTHTQSITESKTVVMSLTKTSTKTDEFSLNLALYKREETKTETYTWTNETTVKTETEITISVSREVLVPALESVVVCTAIHFIEDFQASYLAKAVYRAKSLSVSEIISELAKDNIRDLSVEKGNVVLNNYDGEFMGSIALNTQFIVSPYDGLEGCKQLVANDNQRKQMKFRQFESKFR